MADLEVRLRDLENEVAQARLRYEQVIKAAAKASQDLEKVRSEYTAEEKKLNAFMKKAEAGKQRIRKEVEDCHQHANVTKEEVVTAGQIKSEVGGHGFTLELMLGLSQEFAGHKNAREKLAGGLKERGSLNKYLDDLADWGEKERARIKSEIAGLESQNKGLEGDNCYLENVLSQLQADIDGEEELRRFYHCYQGVSGLMEYLAGWNQVFFLCCNNPLSAFTGAIDHNARNARFWTDKPPAMCPHCGYRQLLYDEMTYQTLNWPVGDPLRLRLGE